MVEPARDMASRLAEVRDRIESAAVRSGRAPAEVRLVAVSKKFPLDAIQEAIDLGIEDFGENRAQEFREKVEILGSKARWHFVGHVQTNKARQVLGAHLVHSVDRYGLAEALDRRARRAGGRQDVLIEVNVSGEPAKHGVEPARLGPLAEEVAGLEGLDLRGLMTMAPRLEDPERARPIFAGLRELSEMVQVSVPGAGELSMGMTDDYEVAVEEGATIVRVGRAIFGPRG